MRTGTHQRKNETANTRDTYAASAANGAYLYNVYTGTKVSLQYIFSLMIVHIQPLAAKHGRRSKVSGDPLLIDRAPKRIGDIRTQDTG